MAQAMNVTEFALPCEDLLRPFAGHGHGFGERAEQLDDLGYVIVIFAILCSGLGVEEIVASDQLKDLEKTLVMSGYNGYPHTP